MLFSRFIPVIAPMAMAASLAKKKPTPLTVGTMRTDTLTFGFLLFGTIILSGRCSSSRWPRSDRSRSISGRCPLEVRRP